MFGFSRLQGPDRFVWVQPAPRARPICLGLAGSKGQADYSYQEGREPGDAALEKDNVDGPFSAHFAADGGYGGDAGSVEKAEYQDAGRGEAAHDRGEGGLRLSLIHI